jgi:hypothetical protein
MGVGVVTMDAVVGVLEKRLRDRAVGSTSLWRRAGAEQPTKSGEGGVEDCRAGEALRSLVGGTTGGRTTSDAVGG